MTRPSLLAVDLLAVLSCLSACDRGDAALTMDRINQFSSRWTGQTRALSSRLRELGTAIDKTAGKAAAPADQERCPATAKNQSLSCMVQSTRWELTQLIELRMDYEIKALEQVVWKHPRIALEHLRQGEEALRRLHRAFEVKIESLARQVEALPKASPPT